MRYARILTLCVVSTLGLTACSGSNSSDDIEKTLGDVNVIDESNLNDILLTAADPREAVSYFSQASAASPDRIDLKRGLAISLGRANQSRAASKAWQDVLALPGATNEDRLEYADALIRANDWEGAQAQLNQVPPTHESFKRYRLEAIIADSNKDWNKADSFYEIAVGLTTRPSGTLNNWGYSKLTRGEYVEAEKLFAESLTYDPTLFTAKNNLVLARAAQRKYEMPVVQMTQVEHAELLHTAALSAIKQGDVNTGKALLSEAISTHPQHFDSAVRSLEALDNAA